LPPNSKKFIARPTGRSPQEAKAKVRAMAKKRGYVHTRPVGGLNAFSKTSKFIGGGLYRARVMAIFRRRY
jgi:hypothetical protein